MDVSGIGYTPLTGMISGIGFPTFQININQLSLEPQFNYNSSIRSWMKNCYRTTLPFLTTDFTKDNFSNKLPNLPPKPHQGALGGGAGAVGGLREQLHQLFWAAQHLFGGQDGWENLGKFTGNSDFTLAFYVFLFGLFTDCDPQMKNHDSGGGVFIENPMG